MKRKHVLMSMVCEERGVCVCVCRTDDRATGNGRKICVGEGEESYNLSNLVCNL